MGSVPGWRNWQTRRTQNPVLAREWEFDPPLGTINLASQHHRKWSCPFDVIDPPPREEPLSRTRSLTNEWGFGICYNTI